MVISFPWSIGARSIEEKDDYVLCHKCNSWVHIKCNNLNYIDYQYIYDNNEVGPVTARYFNLVL